MFKKILSLIIMSSMLFITAGCFSHDGSVEFGSSVDYLDSKIVALGQGIANGSTYLYVEIHVRSSDGTSVPNFVPELSSSTAEVIVHNCNSTDDSGIARCAITSTLPGIKTLNLENALGASITVDVEFLIPSISTTVVSNVPGSSIVNAITTPTGYKVSASLSNISAPLKYDAPSGYTVFSTVQGITLSDDFLN